MALPAGRYGVTKNQLLKIKKLPMNTIKLIEELAEKYDLLGTAAFKNSTSVVTDSTDLVESGAVYTALQGKVDNTVIAPVENGTTASQAYAVGSHAIRNGAFITWKNAKAQGETINDASDYTSGDVAGLLETSRGTVTITIGSPHTARTQLRRYGNVVALNMQINGIPANQSANTWIEIGSINILPSFEIIACLVMDNDGGEFTPVMFEITTTGKLYINMTKSLTRVSRLYGSVVFILNN